MLACYPGTVTLEMETAQLLDLARCSRGSIRAAAGVIALADRQSNGGYRGAWRAGVAGDCWQHVGRGSLPIVVVVGTNLPACP